MRSIFTSLIAGLTLTIATTASAGQSGTWAKIVEIAHNDNGFHAVLDRDINTHCASRNIVTMNAPTRDQYRYDVRNELSYKTVVAQVTVAFYENSDVYVFFRDDAKGCADGFTSVAGINVR